MKPERNRERRQSVQSADTVVAVLKGLARLGGRATLTALASSIDENPAKLHRYLVSLIDGGLVIQDPVSQHYILGLDTMLIGLAAMHQADPIRIAEPGLIALCEQLQITSFIAVMGNKGPTIVRMEEPMLPVTVNVRVGSVLPLLTSATGRVFLGMHDEPLVRRMANEEFSRYVHSRRVLAPQGADDSQGLSFNPEQVDIPELGESLDTLIGKVQQDISRYHCTTVIDTNLKGISAVAAPIFNFAGQVAAVVTVLGASGSFDATLTGPTANTVRDQAQRISRQLGFVDGPPNAMAGNRQ